MSMERIITIDGQPVKFRASAAIPRLYRIEFHRDIYKDLTRLEKSVSTNNEDSSTLDIESLEMFENIAYIMARHADSTISKSVETWLENFNTFSIYTVLPQLIDLWGLNTQTQVTSKKNS